MDIPLLFAITERKNARTTLDLRIVLDFEKAAIKAAKKCFPSASVQGCGFHLAQAWNRKRDALGLGSEQKWDINELRISNAAESFNRELGVISGVKYPCMGDLIKALQGCTITARVTLLNFEQR
ncbi:hypothetical protein GCK32_001021 [Trichostrongylus colubriformis]|uniref:MULE transposase domain-containing protein n=1 Tax=Trichostrongylus colubriformis TaxID=6319 RepID=A0AAN8F030_TRICO